MNRIRVAFEGWGILLGVPALFVAAYIYGFFPALDHVQICAVRRFLGFECPGCGLTRSFAALVYGNIRKSIDLHPLGIVIAVWLIYMFLRAIYILILGRKPRELLTQKYRDLLMYVFLAALLIHWVVKLTCNLSRI